MANIDELKSTGLKATLPRLKILEIFQQGGQRHMTAENVFRVLLEERSDIGLATVYRVLTQFESNRPAFSAAAILNRAKPSTNSTKGSTMTIWSAWTVAGSRSSTMPRSKNARTMWPPPKASSSPTMR